jgi:hypothetical protein
MPEDAYSVTALEMVCHRGGAVEATAIIRASPRRPPGGWSSAV